MFEKWNQIWLLHPSQSVWRGQYSKPQMPVWTPEGTLGNLTAAALQKSIRHQAAQAPSTLLARGQIIVPVLPVIDLLI